MESESRFHPIEPVNKGKSILFEISVAEIRCRKDNAEILSSTIKDELTNGLKRLAME